MQEFIAKNSRALYWYCKIFLTESVDYTIEPFTKPNGKPAFRLKADITEVQAKAIQREFSIFCR